VCVPGGNSNHRVWVVGGRGTNMYQHHAIQVYGCMEQRSFHLSRPSIRAHHRQDPRSCCCIPYHPIPPPNSVTLFAIFIPTAVGPSHSSFFLLYDKYIPRSAFRISGFVKKLLRLMFYSPSLGDERTVRVHHRNLGGVTDRALPGYSSRVVTRKPKKKKAKKKLLPESGGCMK
jgi:hypothetical protein